MTAVADRVDQAPPIDRRRTGTRLLVALTALWAVFLGLHLLLTGHWWLWFFFEGAPPLVFLAVPVVLLAFVPFTRRARKRLAAVLVLLALAGAHLAGYGPGWGTPSGSVAGTPVKVFSWNAQYWQMDDDKTAFYAFLRQQKADVYLLQEQMYWDKAKDQPVRIDDSTQLRRQFPGYRVLVEGELVTLTHLPVVAAPQPPLTQAGPAWFWDGPKAQRTDLRIGGRTVSFYNVHEPVPITLDGSPLHSAFFTAEKQQAEWRRRELSQLRAQLAANPDPAVVAGDFNSSWMDSSTLGEQMKVHSPAAAALPARSWPISQFRLPRAWRLDWLYTSGGLAVPHYRFTDAHAFSDHAAQTIGLVVPAAGKDAT